jgi:hypothetical protein
MKTIYLNPTISVTIEDDGTIIHNTDWGNSIGEVYENDQYRDPTDAERILVDTIIPQIIK